MLRFAQHDIGLARSTVQEQPMSDRRVGLLSGLLLIAIACGPAARAPADAGQTAPGGAARTQQLKRITVGVRGTAQVLYTKLNIGNAGLGVAETERLVHAGLGQQDDAEQLHATLAESMPSIDNGQWVLLPDGRMETTWRIRQGARWHDGVPITTADLIFTAAVAQDREIPVMRDQTFAAVERLDAVDDRTLKVLWSRPYVQADALFSFVSSTALANVTPLPKHLLEQPFWNDKPNFHQLPFWTTEFVGAGPYRVKEYDRDTGVVLVANDAFVLGRPKIDEIEVKFIPDANTIIANLLSGTLDATFDPRSISFAQALQIKDQWREGQVIYARTTWVVMYPQFINPTPPQVADVRFRRAMLQTIDRQDIVDTMQSGVGGVAHHYIGPDWAEYSDVESSIVRYSYDPRAAMQGLESLGFAKGSDGVYRDPAGQRFTVEIRTTMVDINSKSSFTVADGWQRFGVPTEVAIVPPQRTNEREYRATFPGFELIRPTATLLSFESSKGSEVPLPETNWAGANRARYRNAELDGLIDHYFATIPIPERRQTLAQIVHHMTDQLPIMGIVYDPPLRLVANRIRNMPAGITWNGWEWDVV
jgi:peptide/nickel transport system substrate-binding protein